MIKEIDLDLSGVGVGTQPLAPHPSDDVHEASVVLHALLRPGKRTASTEGQRLNESITTYSIDMKIQLDYIL